MKVIDQEISHQIEVKKSIFLSYVFPYKEFDLMMQTLRERHPKAVHFVYAYRKLQAAQITERFSDDGEPKGSSGMPILNVLRGNDLIESAVIVVRYFGGTLLGVGGLVRAYTQSVVECLKKAQHNGILQEFIPTEEELIACPYSLLNRVEYLAKTLEIELQKQDFGMDAVCIKIDGQKEKLAIFKRHFEALQFSGTKEK